MKGSKAQRENTQALAGKQDPLKYPNKERMLNWRCSLTLTYLLTKKNALADLFGKPSQYRPDPWHMLWENQSNFIRKFIIYIYIYL